MLLNGFSVLGSLKRFITTVNPQTTLETKKHLTNVSESHRSIDKTTNCIELNYSMESECLSKARLAITKMSLYNVT